MSRKQLKSIETCGRLSQRRPPDRPMRRLVTTGSGRRCPLLRHRRRVRSDRRPRRPAIDPADAASSRSPDEATEADVTSESAVVDALRRSGSSCRRGRSATPGPGSRSSPSAACRATRTRRSPTPPRCTASPASRRRWRCTSRGTRSTTTPTSRRHAADSASRSARSTRTRSRTTTTCSAASATPTPRVRRKAVDHLLECVDIMDATGSRDLKLWFADGTNYPGQDDIRDRQDRLAESLADGLRAARRRTSGWCSSTSSSSRRSTRPTCPTGAPRYVHCLALGAEGARSSSTPATTRRARTSSSSSRRCCAPASSAAFDFNSRFYADDDLMVGAADPFQLFRIMYEVVQAGALRPERGRRVHARPVPQHRAEDPRPDPLGDERAGGDRQGAARRPRRARGGAATPVTCSAPTRC